MPEFVVVLVEPKYSGNVGAVARSMMNFDVRRLVLVNPACPLDQTCYARAMHATGILDSAVTAPTFADALKDLDFLVATSSVEANSEKYYLRTSVLLDKFASDVAKVEGTVGLVFGREDYGLFNEEIAACDILVKIPTSDAYPSLNLSHAVALVLYELYKERRPGRNRRKLGRVENDTLQGFFAELLDNIGYPAHKKAQTKIMFRRMMGRAMPSVWEYHTFMGVLSKTLSRLKKKK
jgi:TrmH family RNA methyltransferase